MYEVNFPIPTRISDHPVTRRGVHWGSQWHHGLWIEGYRDRDWEDWTEWARSMHLSWAVLLSADDSALLPHQEAKGKAKGLSAVQILLEVGIIPIVRFGVVLPERFALQDHVETLIQQVRPYKVPTYILLGNEFGDPREWKDGEVPKDWMERAFTWWIDAARTCLAFDSPQQRVVVGFPDGPDYPTDPFQFMKELPGKEPPPKGKKGKKGDPYASASDVEEFLGWWEKGQVFYAGHFYGLNRPPDYPDDLVSREGTLLTEAEHEQLLGKFYQTKKNDPPLAHINKQREEKAWAKHNKPRPELTACWRSWERVVGWMQAHFGKVLPIAVTEGGWTPDAIAGTTPETIDSRWPKPIPETVADYTLHVFDKEDSPLFAICPWVAAASLMQEKGDWEGDSWRSTAYLVPELGYGQDMPVVQVLRENPPPGEGPGEEEGEGPGEEEGEGPGEEEGEGPGEEEGEGPGEGNGGPEMDGNVQRFIDKGLIDLDLQGDAYKLEKIIWMPPGDEEGMSKNLHHIFVDVVERREDGKDQRIFDQVVNVSWFDSETNATKIVPVKIEKPENEPWGGNFPMFNPMGTFTVEVAAAVGTSDKVAGLGMGTPEEPDVKHHTSFGLVFRKI